MPQIKIWINWNQVCYLIIISLQLIFMDFNKIINENFAQQNQIYDFDYGHGIFNWLLSELIINNRD